MQFTIIPDEIPNNIEVSSFSAVWRQIRNTVVTGTGFCHGSARAESYGGNKQFH